MMGERFKCQNTANPKRSRSNITATEKSAAPTPPVGLVTPETDRDAGKKTYTYDPHRSQIMEVGE